MQLKQNEARLAAQSMATESFDDNQKQISNRSSYQPETERASMSSTGQTNINPIEDQQNLKNHTT